MTGYLKGFGFSFLLHAAALALILWFTPGGADRDLIVIDFSAIALGGAQEGGAQRGPGPEQKKPPALTQAEPEAETEPAPKPEPIPAEQAVPVKEKTLGAKPAPQREAAAARAAVTPGAQTGSGGTPEGRGIGTGQEEGLAQGYARANFNYILARIQRNLNYPSQARRMNFSGTSKFSFIINLDGSIAELHLEESSGHHILDEAARKAIQRAAPFPAPPVPARLIIPIKFSLRG